MENKGKSLCRKKKPLLCILHEAQHHAFTPASSSSHEAQSSLDSSWHHSPQLALQILPAAASILTMAVGYKLIKKQLHLLATDQPCLPFCADVLYSLQQCWLHQSDIFLVIPPCHRLSFHILCGYSAPHSTSLMLQWLSTPKRALYPTRRSLSQPNNTGGAASCWQNLLAPVTRKQFCSCGGTFSPTQSQAKLV